METLKRPYRVDLGTAQCNNCGSSIRKYYIALNSHKPICSKCVNQVFNLNLSKEELSVPMKLIALADKYMLHRLYLQQYRNEPIKNGYDFSLGFVNYSYGDKGIYVQGEKHYFEGKPLKKGWLEAIQHHLQQRYHSITKDEQNSHRRTLVCGNCKKPLYFAGRINQEGKQYDAYHCLAGKECANCNSNIVTLYSSFNQQVVGLIKADPRKLYLHNT